MTTEADALANMMGADSRRIDGLAEAVGDVRGSVQALRGDMGHVSKGVDELRGAMTILSRHAVVMETVLTDISALRAAVTAQDASLAINGQALRVSDAFAGAGLALAGGLRCPVRGHGGRWLLAPCRH